MKHAIIAAALICLSLPLTPLPAKAEETKAEPPSHVAITVVMPDAVSEPPTAPVPAAPILFPVNVEESSAGAGRQIVKTYELSAGEKPGDIPREPFERGGWSYTLADIVKKETIVSDTREYAETVTLDSATDDAAAILKLLAPTKDYAGGDGYAGVLTLDAASVQVAEAGTKNSSFTATATREYPHLSANDTSLVPKTITENGRTLTLSGVTWKTGGTDAVDYYQLPESYTAVATYTRTGTRITVTGYTVTAEYRGSVSKVSPGKTVYAAYFIGEEIPLVLRPLEIVGNNPAQEPGAVLWDTPSSEETETPLNAGVETDAEPTESPEAETGREAPEDTTEATGAKSSLLPIIAASLCSLLIGGGAWHLISKKFPISPKSEEEKTL